MLAKVLRALARFAAGESFRKIIPKKASPITDRVDVFFIPLQKFFEKYFSFLQTVDNFLKYFAKLLTQF
jgi:hypothetical protein